MSAELERLDALYAQARALQDRGEYEAALEIARGLIEPARRYLGDQHDGLAEVLTTVGILCRRTGRLTEAEPLYQEALGIRRRVLGADDPGVAATESSLAVLYLALGRAAEAEPLLRSSLEIRRRAFGDDDPDVAFAMTNLAGAYVALDRLQDAERLLVAALEGFGGADGDPRAIETLRILARVRVTTGRTAEVIPLRERALRAARRLLPPDHPITVECAGELAADYLEAGRYADAEPLYRERLASLAGQGGPEASLTYADSLASMALLHRRAGRLDDAEREYKDVLELTRGVVAADDPRLGAAMNNLAAVYREQGRYELAVPLFEQAIEIQRRHGEPGLAAAALNNLALLHDEQGDRERAKALYEEALDATRRLLGDAHPQVATVLNNLAEVHRESGSIHDALRLQREANEGFERAFGEWHPSLSRGLLNLAKTLARAGRLTEALDAQLRSARIDDRTLAQVLPLGSERQRAHYMESVVSPLYATLSLVAQQQEGSRAGIPETFDLVLRRKALGAEALTAQREAILEGGDPELLARLRQLVALQARSSRSALAGGDADEGEREAIETELARALAGAGGLERVWSAGRRDVARRLPPRSVLIECVRFPLWDVAAAPAPGEQMVWRSDRYAVFTMAASDPDGVSFVDLGEAAPLDDLITAFRASIGGRDGTFAPDVAPSGLNSDAGRALGAVMRERLLPALDGATRLLIAPDGDLARLPFETLPLDGGRHWIDAFEISYLTTGRDVLRFDLPLGPGTSPLVIAAPDFDLAAPGPPPEHPPTPAEAIDALYFPPLPESRVEGERVARLLGVEPLLGPAAVESAITACRSPRMLHIATHGYFLPNALQLATDGGVAVEAPSDGTLTMAWAGSTPEESFGGAIQLPPGRLGRVGLQEALLRSGLALAGANAWLEHRALPEEAEDGFLTAEDVARLDLLATELVVLSACETALGEVRVGEGVFGLRRACFLAGARTLVMSLWKVPDDATRALMEDLYRRVLAGEPRSAALREAQLAMKASDPDPLAWGGFICQGDPGVLTSQHPEHRPAEQRHGDHLGTHGGK